MGEFSQFALVPEQGVVPRKEQLDTAMQSRIEQMAARLDLSDPAAVMGFGARAQKEMAAFSDIALQQMLKEDVSPLSGVMQTLAEQIKECDFGTEAKGFLRRMFGGAESLPDLRRRYEKAEPKINACANDMTDRRVALMQNSALLDRLYERNEALYRELCSLIVIGDEAAAQAQARGAAESGLQRITRRMQDLRVTQLASTQLAAQIRMVQQSNQITCEKLQTALEVTIPLWKSQMAAALGLAQATEYLNRHRRFSEEAQRGMRRESRTLDGQRTALSRETAESDRERAQHTAEALLRDLDEIEQSLKEQEQARKGLA